MVHIDIFGPIAAAEDDNAQGGWISAISTWIRQMTPHHNGS